MWHRASKCAAVPPTRCSRAARGTARRLAVASIVSAIATAATAAIVVVVVVVATAAAIVVTVSTTCKTRTTEQKMGCGLVKPGLQDLAWAHQQPNKLQSVMQVSPQPIQ